MEQTVATSYLHVTPGALSVVMADKNCISPDKILKLVAQLADLVKGSLGEDGEAVMINIRSPRQIVVTKVIKVTCTQWQAAVICF